MGDDDPTTILMSPTARSMAKSSKALSISPSESPSQARGSKKNVSPPSAVGGANGAEFSPKSGSRQALHNNGASEFYAFHLPFRKFFVTSIADAPHPYYLFILTLILILIA